MRVISAAKTAYGSRLPVNGPGKAGAAFVSLARGAWRIGPSLPGPGGLMAKQEWPILTSAGAGRHPAVVVDAADGACLGLSGGARPGAARAQGLPDPPRPRSANCWMLPLAGGLLVRLSGWRQRVWGPQAGWLRRGGLEREPGRERRL